MMRRALGLLHRYFYCTLIAFGWLRGDQKAINCCHRMRAGCPTEIIACASPYPNLKYDKFTFHTK